MVKSWMKYIIKIDVHSARLCLIAEGCLVIQAFLSIEKGAIHLKGRCLMGEVLRYMLHWNFQYTRDHRPSFKCWHALMLGVQYY